MAWILKISALDGHEITSVVIPSDATMIDMTDVSETGWQLKLMELRSLRNRKVVMWRDRETWQGFVAHWERDYPNTPIQLEEEATS